MLFFQINQLVQLETYRHGWRTSFAFACFLLLRNLSSPQVRECSKNNVYVSSQTKIKKLRNIILLIN